MADVMPKMVAEKCQVGWKWSRTLHPFGHDAEDCAKQLAKQTGKPHGTSTYVFSDFSAEETVIALPECKMGNVYYDDNRAGQCAASLQQITGRSYAVSAQSLGWFSSAYLIVELCTSKTK